MAMPLNFVHFWQLLRTEVSEVRLFFHIPSSEILEFPSVINFDIITSGDINFTSCRNLEFFFFFKHL